jgi:ankyrin repeat protein
VIPGLLKGLNDVVPWPRLSLLEGINSVSRIDTGLRIFLPEAKEGQHYALATRISGYKQTSLDTFSITMFLLSNNLIPKGDRKSHDQRVLKMLRDFGWDSRPKLQELLSSKEPTAGAIMEQLFGSALREFDIDIVSMLLDAGMSPDCLIDGDYSEPSTPLGFLARHLRDRRATDPIGLLNLLLSHGADIDKSGGRSSPLERAVCCRDTDTIEWFLSHGAQITRSCIAAAAEYIGNVKLFERFLRSDNDVNGWEDPKVGPLALASSSGHLSVTNLLLSRGADVNALVQCDHPWPWGWTTVLGYACQYDDQDPEVIQALIDACPDINPTVDDREYLSPLTVAVACIPSNYDVIELLLRAGIDIRVADTCEERTLLELALRGGATWLCHLLLIYEAMIDRPLLSGMEQPTSALFCAIEQGATDLAAELIARGARLNDMYTRPPGTVLALAIEKGYLPLIKTLQFAGAIAIGFSVRRIGNFETAVHLEESGHLQRILNISGGQILGAALAAGQIDLAEGLLRYQIDLNAPINHHLGMTPLQAAIIAKQLSFAYTLLDCGAHVTDGTLVEAVKHFSSAKDHGDLLARLLSKFQGRAPTAMAEAILLKRPDFVQLILAFGVDPTGKPSWADKSWNLNPTVGLFTDAPESVLEVLCQNPDRAILARLFAACPWAPQLVGRALALSVSLRRHELVDDWLRAAVNLEQEIKIKGFLEQNTNGDRVYITSDHITSLQLAAKIQDLWVVERLLGHHSIDINYLGRGEYRRTALQYAVDSGNMDLVNLLISHGADINAPPAPKGGATALQIAAICGYLGIARRLIDLRADVNAPGAVEDGRTALEGAAEYGRIDMLHMLLDDGASVTGEFGGRQYRRAIEFAERRGHQAAARLLMAFEPR